MPSISASKQNAIYDSGSALLFNTTLLRLVVSGLSHVSHGPLKNGLIRTPPAAILVLGDQYVIIGQTRNTCPCGGI
jgi:hypothetical protein